MPAKSEAQRRFLNATKGHAWVQRHGFDNAGPLPKKVKAVKKKTKATPKKKAKKGKKKSMKSY